MPPLSFLNPNQQALQRSDRIADGVWERYRAEIIRQYHSGGGKGNAQALKWIKSLNNPDFNPRLVLVVDLIYSRLQPPTNTKHLVVPSSFDIGFKWSGRKNPLTLVRLTHNLHSRTRTMPVNLLRLKKKESMKQNPSCQPKGGTELPICRILGSPTSNLPDTESGDGWRLHQIAYGYPF